MLMIIPIVLGFGLYTFTTQAQEVEDPEGTETPTATIDRLIEEDGGESVTATAVLTPTDYDQYLTQTAGAQPTPTPEVTRRGDFRDGAWVRINAGAGDCLNARNTPSLASEWVIVNICVPDGYEGLLSGTAQQAEGHWWWYLAGLGWVAEDYLVYAGEFDARNNVVTELGGVAGKVAFLRGNDIWMMNPDGSGQILLKDHPESGDTYVPRPTNLAWSPAGNQLAFNVERHDVIVDPERPGRVDLHILTIRPDGTLAETMFDGVAGGGWSPDNVHIGIVRDASPDQMGGSTHGVPAVLDVTTGGQLVLGSTPGWQQKAPAFNHDGSLLMAGESTNDGTTWTSALVIYTADGAEYDRIDFSSAEIGYASPAWSATANQIAMHIQRRIDETTYASEYQVYDLETRSFIAATETPKMSERIGGRCGGGDMWSTEWSLGGSRVMYSYMFGDTGANGIWSWDVAGGGQRVIIAANASSPAAGPDGLVMFASDEWGSPHIFYGTVDGGFPRIITDGASPAWWVP
jgi:Tol biopolymer transport system component